TGGRLASWTAGAIQSSEPFGGSPTGFLCASLLVLVYSSFREYSVRQYLAGFSAAIVSQDVAPEQRIEAILQWMRAGSFPAVASDPAKLCQRDPEVTLSYQRLLAVDRKSTRLNSSHDQISY